MRIDNVWTTQRTLNRKDQIDDLILSIKDGKYIPPVEINLADDGEFEIEDGHHRMIAYFLAGKTDLQPWEYTLKFCDSRKPRFNTISERAENVRL